MKKSMLFGMLSGALLLGCAINAHAAAAPHNSSLLTFNLEAVVPAVSSADIVANVDHDQVKFTAYNQATHKFDPVILNDAFNLSVPTGATDVQVTLKNSPNLSAGHPVAVAFSDGTAITSTPVAVPASLLATDGKAHTYNLKFNSTGTFTETATSQDLTGGQAQLMFSATY